MFASPSIEQVFADALTRPAGPQRAHYLDEVCGADADVRQRVERLLRAYGDAESFLESPAADPAPTIGQPLERPGTQIGPYKLIEQIGEGGFGVVFMAAQTEPVRRKVALKVLKPGMDTRQVVARFEAERQALAIMDHPNIAKVLDGGATPSGRPYFVMDLVRGVSITEFCDQNHLRPRERLELFASVCQTVQHAHQKGIIHRDLKPSNVLVTVHDTQPVIKVIDFGVAKAVGQELTDRSLFTGFAQMIGTPLYMSPEQAGQSGLDIDTRSDIYSLGVLLYELLTGTTPFGKDRLGKAGYDEIRRIIREEEPAKPSTRISTLAQAAADTVSSNRQSNPQRLKQLVRGELDWIVMKALEKDRSRRYETASALAADVQRYLRDEPVEACPPSAWYRFSKFARRHQRAIATAATVAVVVLLMAAASGLLIWRAVESERHGAYYQRIALAEREWGANNLSRMEELLDDCPDDLRGWEWWYLKRLRYGAPSPLRHESGVYCVAFSPDGQYLATSTKDGFIRLCRATTGSEIQQWRAHEENTTCVQFSPDGQYLASAGWDAQIKVWAVEKVLQNEVSKPLLCLKHTAETRLWSVAFRPEDGKRLVSAGRTPDLKGEVKVWDLSTGQEVVRIGGIPEGLYCVRYSADGRRFATASFTGGVDIWDAETGQKQLAVGGRGYTDLAFSPDGRCIAAVGGLFTVHPNREVEVWDAWTGQKVLSLRGHVGALRCVAFSPDGRCLASAGLDQTVKLWDVATGQELITLRGHIDNVFSVAFSPDGYRLASVGLDRTLRIWDATPPGPDTHTEYFTLRGHKGAVTDVAFHPADRRTLVSAGTDGTIAMWDYWSGKKLGTLPEAPSAFKLKVAYSPDGQRLAVASGAEDQRDARVWDVATAKEICAFKDHLKGELCVAFSPDGQYVASAGFDYIVRVWDAATGTLRQPLEGHDWPIHGVAFSPDGRHIASCSADSTVRVWDWTTGEALPVLEPQHAARVVNVAFSRDGKLLASASWDRTIKIWDTTSWKLLHDLHDSTEAAVQCVAFDRDGPRLVWGSTDGTIKVWDGPGSETQVLRGHTSWIHAVAISADGQSIASASLDGTVKVWKAPPESKAPALPAKAQDQASSHSAEE